MQPTAVPPPRSAKGHTFFTSLPFKVGLLTSIIMLVVVAVFAAVFIVTERQKAEESILETGRTFAGLSAKAMYDNYLQFYTHPQPEDFANFKSRISDILQQDTDIKSVMLLSLNGRVLFDTQELESGKYSGTPRTTKDKDTIAALSNSTITTRKIVHQNNDATEIIVPLLDANGGHFLAMRYVLSYDSLQKEVIEAYQRILVIAILLMIFVAAIATALSLQLTRPIIKLTQIAEQIRIGNFDARAPEKGKDELGILSRVINQMAAQLKNSYLGLETKVHERTKELEATQVELQASVNRHDALLASIGDGVLATDAQGNILLINKVAEDLIHKKHTDIIGKPYTVAWKLASTKGDDVGEQEQPMYLALNKALATRSSEFAYIGADESGQTVSFPVAISVSPVLIDDRIIGAICIFRDITHEKEVDRMKTEFISLASHQLRTPLSAIKWFSEMMVNGDAGKLSKEQSEFAKNIEASAERMIELVNSLLNISRMESGRIMIDPKPTDLNDLIQGIVSDLKAKTATKKQTLVVSVNKEIGKINIDPQLVGQIYLNLLTNAIKYTPEGGEISVFVSRKDGEVISQVTDNGYGIPKEQQTKVFQKFFRAENVVKIETDGTGLGLYLVKAIVESSGGKIWFKSESGKGTTFWFSLPMSGMKAKAGEVTLMESSL